MGILTGVFNSDFDASRDSGGSYFCVKLKGLTDSLNLKEYFSFQDEKVLFFCTCGGKGYQVFSTDEYVESTLTFEAFRARLGDPRSPYLLGIWLDAEAGYFYIFRDFFGRSPFYYSLRGGRLYFSTSYSELAGLLRVREHLTPDTDTIRRYLSPGNYSARYRAATFYSEIKAAIPGYLTQISTGVPFHAYIVGLTGNRYKDLRTIEEFGEVFKERLFESVKTALRGKKRVGSQLSGGLDSSSLVGVARKIRAEDPITGVFMTGKAPVDPEILKRHDFTYVKEVAADCRVEMLELPVPMSDSRIIKDLVKELGQPPAMLGIDRLYEILSRLKKRNCDVMLSGALGDSVVGYGWECMDVYWEQGAWDRVNEAFEKLAETDRYFPLRKEKGKAFVLHRIKKTYLLRKLALARRLGEWAKIPELALMGSLRLKLSPVDIMSSMVAKLYKKADVGGRKFRSILPEVSALPKFEEAEKGEEGLFRDIQINHNIRMMEEFNVIGSYAGVKIETPYCDPALYELCESVPSDLKFYNGVGRGQLREGLKGILTESVRLRSNKTSPDASEIAEWTANLYKCYPELLHESAQVWDYVDREAFFYNKRLFEGHSFPLSEISQLFGSVGRVIMLSAWLEVTK